ncbi:hypothetical protein [Petropleomorpha daqingensis]|uniref:DUF4352 domain-containing protein n=1 Tax=Petropleomorpha daqingensis TaxID=2026353 RepID=A0A853CJW9_9ACTN|nr:hypothetical protein [Petropleomorpha daqingensis]NYJ07471.1 hypothetical protein [Petropleomorpha daqingensis]
MTAPAPTRRSRRDLLLRRVLPALAVLVVAAVVVFLVLRGGDDGSGNAAAASSTSAAAPSTDLGLEPTESSPSVSPSPATEAPAPTVVSRPGVPEASRTVQATNGDFAATASWSDGATIRVAEAHQQVTSGTGPGELAGQPQTVFNLELVNGTDKPLDLNTVVVQATYGSGPTQASPIYDQKSVDFGGTLAPGDTATAVYSFAIPADQLGKVTLSVDVDGFRFPAVFSGAVPA